MCKVSREKCLTITLKWLLIIEKLICHPENGGDDVDRGAAIYLAVCLNCVCAYTVSFFMTAISNTAARAAPLWFRLIDWTL